MRERDTRGGISSPNMNIIIRGGAMLSLLALYQDPGKISPHRPRIYDNVYIPIYLSCLYKMGVAYRVNSPAPPSSRRCFLERVVLTTGCLPTTYHPLIVPPLPSPRSALHVLSYPYGWAIRFPPGNHCKSSHPNFPMSGPSVPASSHRARSIVIPKYLQAFYRECLISRRPSQSPAVCPQITRLSGAASLLVPPLFFLFFFLHDAGRRRIFPPPYRTPLIARATSRKHQGGRRHSCERVRVRESRRERVKEEEERPP